TIALQKRGGWERSDLPGRELERTNFYYCVPFFFSSRRRHTRWPRDWSSDVCSSDLLRLHLFAEALLEFLGEGGRLRIGVRWPGRSEERRVGKECRSRRWPYHEKKKGQRATGGGVEGRGWSSSSDTARVRC